MENDEHITKHQSITQFANHLFPYFLIIITGIICYSGTFDSPFAFDDRPSITENLSIQNLSDLKSIWKFSETRFLTYLSFALNFHFHGLNVFGYHLVNLTIHLLAALSVFWLVRLIFLTPELKKNLLSKQVKSIALTVSLLFVSHPIQTQAVTYIVQRAASMAALFYLLSVALYIKARLHQTRAEKGHILLYSLSITAALIAMFTKEIALTLPLCIILCEYSFFSPSLNQMPRRLSYLWPMLLTFPVIPVTTLLTKAKLIAYVGLATETDTISRQDYLLTQFNVIRTYLRLLFFPINQSVDYDYALAHHLFEPRTLASFLLLIAILVVALILFKKFRVIAFGVLWFYLTLAVESSLIPIRDLIVEHRLYLPCFGIFLSSTALLFYLLGQRMKILKILFTIFICLTFLATINRNIVWEYQVLLWNDVVKQAPNKSRGYLNRGVGYDNLEMQDLAIKDFDLVMELDKTNPYPYHNRGLIYLRRGEIDSAVSEFNRALKKQPNLTKSYVNRGIARSILGEYSEAYKDIYTAVRHEPHHPFHLNALGTVLKKTKRYPLALRAFTRAIELDDEYATPYLNRGTTYNMMGKFEEAIDDFTQATELAPDMPEIYYHSGLTYVGLKNYKKAIEKFTTAITKKPDFMKAYGNRGMSYHRLGLHQRALIDLNRAINLNSNLAKLYLNRGKVYQSLGMSDEAEMDFALAEELESGKK